MTIDQGASLTDEELSGSNLVGPRQRLKGGTRSVIRRVGRPVLPLHGGFAAGLQRRGDRRRVDPLLAELDDQRVLAAGMGAIT